MVLNSLMKAPDGSQVYRTFGLTEKKWLERTAKVQGVLDGYKSGAEKYFKLIEENTSDPRKHVKDWLRKSVYLIEGGVGRSVRDEGVGLKEFPQYLGASMPRAHVGEVFQAKYEYIPGGVPTRDGCDTQNHYLTLPIKDVSEYTGLIPVFHTYGIHRDVSMSERTLDLVVWTENFVDQALFVTKKLSNVLIFEPNCRHKDEIVKLIVIITNKLLRLTQRVTSLEFCMARLKKYWHRVKNCRVKDSLLRARFSAPVSLVQAKQGLRSIWRSARVEVLQLSSAALKGIYGTDDSSNLPTDLLLTKDQWTGPMGFGEESSSFRCGMASQEA